MHSVVICGVFGLPTQPIQRTFKGRWKEGNTLKGLASHSSWSGPVLKPFLPGILAVASASRDKRRHSSILHASLSFSLTSSKAASVFLARPRCENCSAPGYRARKVRSKEEMPAWLANNSPTTSRAGLGLQGLKDLVLERLGLQGFKDLVLESTA